MSQCYFCRFVSCTNLPAAWLGFTLDLDFCKFINGLGVLGLFKSKLTWFFSIIYLYLLCILDQQGSIAVAILKVLKGVGIDINMLSGQCRDSPLHQPQKAKVDSFLSGLLPLLDNINTTCLCDNLLNSDTWMAKNYVNKFQFYKVPIYMVTP